jgi:hypothetical protein
MFNFILLRLFYFLLLFHGIWNMLLPKVSYLFSNLRQINMLLVVEIQLEGFWLQQQSRRSTGLRYTRRCRLCIASAAVDSCSIVGFSGMRYNTVRCSETPNRRHGCWCIGECASICTWEEGRYQKWCILASNLLERSNATSFFLGNFLSFSRQRFCKWKRMDWFPCFYVYLSIVDKPQGLCEEPSPLGRYLRTQFLLPTKSTISLELFTSLQVCTIALRMDRWRENKNELY